MGQGSRQQCYWSHTEASQMTLGLLTDQKCKPIPFRLRQVRLLDRGFRGKEFTRLDIEAFVTTVGYTANRDGKGAQDRLDSCPTRFGQCIRATLEAVERFDRRSETVNEALTQKLDRGVRRKDDHGKFTAVATAQQEPRHARVKLEPEPRRRNHHRRTQETAKKDRDHQQHGD